MPGTSGWVARAALVAVGLAGCGRLTERGPVAEWSDPVTVSRATGGGAAPTFAVGQDGRVALAWVSAPNAGTEGRLSVRPEAAVEAHHQLADSLGGLSIYGEVPPKIAFGPDGTLYAAYLVTKALPGQRWPVHALRFAASHDGGSSWEPPRTVVGGGSLDSLFGSYDDHALFAGPDGTLYLSWLALTGDTSHTYFARSEDRGRTWSSPATIDPGPSCPCCRTAMAAGPDGTLYTAWRKIYPGGAGQTEIRDIAVARSSDRGRTWRAPVRVHADEWQVGFCPDAGPSVKVGLDGVVHVAWWTGKEGSAGVQYTRSTDGGATFGPPVPLGLARYSRAAHVQLGLGTGPDSTLVVAAWDDGTRKVPRIVTRLSRDGGRTFGPTEALSAPDRQAGYPTVAVQGDSVSVAWQERSLVEARRDSMVRSDTGAARYVLPVGSLQVVMRKGVSR
jgi:BNR repeat protein